MPLPKIKQPLFKVVVPSTNKEVMVRPMLVKEEKILLIAREGDDPAEKLLAVRQVVNNCIQKVNVEELTTFDLEYIFLKLRALSVDSKIKIGYMDQDDEQEREFEINLDDVIVKEAENKVDNVIMLDDTAGIELKWPTVSVYDRLKDIENPEDLVEMLAVSCLVKYFDGDEMYDLTKESPEKLKEFVEENLNVAIYNKIKEFLTAMPSLYYKIEYDTEGGEKKTIELTSLNDFFLY